MTFNDLAPQERTVVRHLNDTGSITRMEADTMHRIRHLPTRIFNLKRAGFKIASSFRKDVNGQRYVRYLLQEMPNWATRRVAS